MSDLPSNSSPPQAGRPEQYTVIARRFRPLRFEDLIGQEHVAQALMNAITTERVGHAYLFTGARGVGKTSTARILAKALNCQTKGPTPTPCNECDICRSIGSGDDVDVLEIDGASNRGIDEIRQLRQNVNVRPSRARFKVYIIDEVHMLTREAFNALLKTLEEPPGHVKFIFCTTEPTKVPVTILSRCQRFDFAGIRWESIAECLRKIVDAEGVPAEPEALQLLARRATGSMRDGQSLLEQLLAFSPERITVADVHAMLGSAGEERLARLVGHLVQREPGKALEELDTAVREGVDVGQLLEQLFGYFRDCMAALAGCPAETFLVASPGSKEEVAEAAGRLGLQTLLAAMQILDQALGRLRFSTQGRMLAELALVRIASLEELDEIRALIAQLGGAGPAGEAVAPNASAPARQKVRPAPRPGPASPQGAPPGGERTAREAATRVPLAPENAAQVWNQALGRVSGLGARHAKDYADVATPAPNRLVISFKPAYTLSKSICERPDQVAKFEKALAELTGEPVRVQFVLLEDESDESPPGAPARAVSPQQRLLEISRHPMIRRAAELFDAKPIRVDEPPDKE
jgi:DNA polymerase-3 subunit gamma/tau